MSQKKYSWKSEALKYKDIQERIMFLEEKILDLDEHNEDLTDKIGEWNNKIFEVSQEGYHYENLPEYFKLKRQADEKRQQLAELEEEQEALDHFYNEQAKFLSGNYTAKVSNLAANERLAILWLLTKFEYLKPGGKEPRSKLLNRKKGNVNFLSELLDIPAGTLNLLPGCTKILVEKKLGINEINQYLPKLKKLAKAFEGSIYQDIHKFVKDRIDDLNSKKKTVNI
jgi:hypothetical protein